MDKSEPELVSVTITSSGSKTDWATVNAGERAIVFNLVYKSTVCSDGNVPMVLS